MDAGHRQRMHVERVAQRRPERDDLLHEVWIPMRQHLGEHTAAAVADERYPRPGLPVQRLQGVDERFEHYLRVHDVERKSRESRLVADATQPVVLRAQRPVAREEAGDQQHWLATPRRHVLAAKDRIADQP